MLHYMHCNFCGLGHALRLTPAMQAGVADRVWEIEDFAGLTQR